MAHPAIAWVFYLVSNCGSAVLLNVPEKNCIPKVVDKIRIFDAQVSNIRVPRNVPVGWLLETVLTRSWYCKRSPLPRSWDSAAAYRGPRVAFRLPDSLVLSFHQTEARR